MLPVEYVEPGPQVPTTVIHSDSVTVFKSRLNTFLFSRAFSFLSNTLPGMALTGKGKGSPYSITERRVPELIPVLDSQPAGDVSHKPGGRLPLLSARPAVTPQPLRGLLPVLLFGEQRHNGCEQFA